MRVCLPNTTLPKPPAGLAELWFLSPDYLQPCSYEQLISPLHPYLPAQREMLQHRGYSLPKVGSYSCSPPSAPQTPDISCQHPQTRNLLPCDPQEHLHQTQQLPSPCVFAGNLQHPSAKAILLQQLDTEGKEKHFLDRVNNSPGPSAKDQHGGICAAAHTFAGKHHFILFIIITFI